MVVSASELTAKAALLDQQSGAADTRSDEGIIVSAANANFPIVAVGASAGGLDAVTKLITALPKAPGMAFILIQHLDPTHKSLMAELLAKHTPMPVIEAIDGAAIEIDMSIPSPREAICRYPGTCSGFRRRNRRAVRENPSTFC